MSKSIIILLCVLLSVDTLFSQDSLKRVQKNYKNAKVLLVSGVRIKCKQVTLNDSTLVCTSGEAASSKVIPLSEVSQITVPTNNKLLLGTFLGGALGLGTALAINASSDQTTHSSSTITYSYDESGQRSSTRSPTETSVEYALSNGNIAAIVAGGAALGGLIGSQIIGRWEKIYSKPALSDSLNKNLYFNIKNYGLLEGKLFQLRKNYVYVVKGTVLYKIYRKSLVSILNFQKNDITEKMLTSKDFEGIQLDFKKFSKVIDIQ